MKGNKLKYKINYELVVAISALVISLFTVVIYIYQAQIMSEQHKDSVWPYVFSGKSINNNDGLSIKVYNKGIGPAIIKSVQVDIQGTSYESWRSLMHSFNLDTLNFYCSNVEGTVLSPKEEMSIFGVDSYREARLVWKELQELRVRVTYCSIHDDCWNSDGSEIKINTLYTNQNSTSCQ